MKPMAAIVLLIASLLASPAYAAEPAVEAQPSPEVVVQAQLEAYNRRDLDGFLGFYSDDAVFVNYPDQVTQTGKAQMRSRYASRFAIPDIRATIVKRIVFDRFVIDHERITSGAKAMEAIATYEVKDGKIVRVTFLLK
jgi:hypothetical protein